MPLSEADTVTLADVYAIGGPDRALVSGRQALARLLLVQHSLDRAKGLRTAGLVSGYRGSPLGGFDAELWRIKDALQANDIHFQPGLNEDLALTALAGAQMTGMLPGARFDGVFGLWYGKGPGVDRSGDAIKHANLAGVAEHGGIVLAFGDDHSGKSSTTAHQSDLTLASWEVPILYPANVAEILDYGLAAFALSRFSGALVALKLVNETAESTSVIDLKAQPAFLLPECPEVPNGLHIRSEPRALLERDARLLRLKLTRAQAFARANGLDRLVFGAQTPDIVIATAGKAFTDVQSALARLGIDQTVAEQLGVGVYKIALLFPLDPVSLCAFETAREILFVEEKRAHAEAQAKAILYGHSRQPLISGKRDPEGRELLPADAPLDPLIVATAIARRLEALLPDIAKRVTGWADCVESLRRARTTGSMATPVAGRRPSFCAGCPHNNSTKVPEGSLGGTGIGCHGMAGFYPDRNPIPMAQMGAEGANWIGLSPFTSLPHIFQNLGDGTYSHSGSLAIRAAVAARTNITFKLLFNDAVAMTGGQPVEGDLTIPRLVRQLAAEGVRHICVLSEQPDRFTGTDSLPAGVELRHRDELDRVQREIRSVPGTTVLVYDQVCAAEKRRRRRLGHIPNPPQRIFINAEVCEGCGDCSTQSNCLAIQPLETELGRKRKIDQSACNKDFSCLKGFCPSFVVLEGARPRRKPTVLSDQEVLPEPDRRPLGNGFDMLTAGVGGTGVVTVSAILGMAARLEGMGANIYDMTGLSQKGGAVFSHLRLRATPNTVTPARIGPGEADVLMACDLIAAAYPEAIASIRRYGTRVFCNTEVTATAEFHVQRDLVVPQNELSRLLKDAAGTELKAIAAASLAEQLLGDSIAANILLLGYAWQSGAIPLKLTSIERAIRLNGRAAEANVSAFAAGRRCALSLATPARNAELPLETYIQRRTDDLRRYWNHPYSDRYGELMRKVCSAADRVQGGFEFATAVARSAYKVMAYKDEYEVARLFTDGRFRDALEQQFEEIKGLKFQLAPPLLSRVDPVTGRPRKFSFGGWLHPALRLLAACRQLREGPLDVFRWHPDRRVERQVRDLYLERMSRLADALSADNIDRAIELARSPMQVRGFGAVKAAAAAALLGKLADLER
jgi:indolepyruvate ferredoxin oxidoreductase